MRGVTKRPTTASTFPNSCAAGDYSVSDSRSLRNLARALGGEAVGRDQVACPGPNHSRQDRSLSVRFDQNAPDGFVVHSFAGDDPIRCKDHVRQLLGWPQWQPGDSKKALPRMGPPKTREEDDKPMTDEELERIGLALALWNEAGDPRKTLAETYLQEHRKLDLSDDLAGRVLRFHPQCPWRDENAGTTIYIPALIAAFRSIEGDEITAVHRIGLRPDGTKIDRRMLGVVRRAAIKLDAIPTRELFIGEGIESCMAARQLGCRPAWALGSTGGISFFPVLDGVRLLVIHGEPGRASEEAIKMCGRRWSQKGRRVKVAYSQVGSDFNDALMRNIK
jgi:hypothetical protein